MDKNVEMKQVLCRVLEELISGVYNDRNHYSGICLVSKRLANENVITIKQHKDVVKLLKSEWANMNHVSVDCDGFTHNNPKTKMMFLWEPYKVAPRSEWLQIQISKLV